MRPVGEGKPLGIAGPGRWLARGLVLAALAATLAGCGGVAAPSGQPAATGPTPTEEPTAVPATPTAVPRGRCAGGKLTVGDLAAVNAEWVTGVTAAYERAAAWRADAQLVSLRVACGVLEPTFRWRGTFYSESAQLYYASDTGQTEPVEVEPSLIPVLPTGGLDFLGLERALARAGFADTTELTAANGVEIRLNTEAAPFGPPDAPKSVVYYHVAILDDGEIADLFVHADDWVLYVYTP